MRDGLLEENKAAALSRGTAFVDDDLAPRICAAILPVAPRLPLGALIARIARETIEADPGSAERRRKDAERRVG